MPIISSFIAVGPIARLFARQMYFIIQSRPAWDVLLTFPEALQQELKFWLQYIDSFNGYSITGMLCATCTVYANASDFAFHSYLATFNGEPVRGMFPPADVNTRYTYCELKAVFYVLKSYAERLRHQRVKVFFDNMGGSRILMVGSSKPHLQGIAVDIFSIISLVVVKSSKYICFIFRNTRTEPETRPSSVTSRGDSSSPM